MEAFLKSGLPAPLDAIIGNSRRPSCGPPGVRIDALAHSWSVE
jgi:hypothetical protein